jgi:hypothetical protein
MDYHKYGINGEPEHNTGSMWCWCAPVLMPDGVVVHKSIVQIIELAIHSAAQQGVQADLPCTCPKSSIGFVEFATHDCPMHGTANR